MVTQYGLAIRNFVGPGEPIDIDKLLAYAERAETLGFESLWAFDHLLLGVRTAYPVLEAFTLLAAIAARTQRIKLGTGVVVLSLRNPVWAAKIMATLDHISQGRFILGAASGWYEREFDAAGIPFHERGRIFERNLDLILSLWQGEAVTRQVDGFNLRSAILKPTPFQRPRPPVLLGGYVDKVLRRVARLADGWITFAYTPEDFTKAWDRVKGYARECGRDPSELSATMQMPIYIGPPRAEATEPMMEWMRVEYDFPDWSEAKMETAVRGTIDECVEQLRPYMATDLNRLIFFPYRYELEQLDLIANQLIPRLAAAATAQTVSRREVRPAN
jgi:probable F420-dependent oxidoreductase